MDVRIAAFSEAVEGFAYLTALDLSNLARMLDSRMVEWPDGRRAALLFLLEEETDPAHFSIHRLAHYCLDLAELYATERVVPAAIFLRPGGFPTRLLLGSDNTRTYLDFRYIACALKQIPPPTTSTVPTSAPASTSPTWPMPRRTSSWCTPSPSAA